MATPIIAPVNLDSERHWHGINEIVCMVEMTMYYVARRQEKERAHGLYCQVYRSLNWKHGRRWNDILAGYRLLKRQSTK